MSTLVVRAGEVIQQPMTISIRTASIRTAKCSVLQNAGVLLAKQNARQLQNR